MVNIYWQKLHFEKSLSGVLVMIKLYLGQMTSFLKNQHNRYVLNRSGAAAIIFR